MVNHKPIRFHNAHHLNILTALRDPNSNHLIIIRYVTMALSDEVLPSKEYFIFFLSML